MKIGIQTWGSEGDINPFIALAAELAKAGHDVKLAITSADRRDFSPFAQKYGFKIHSVDFIAESEEKLNEIGKRMIQSPDHLKQLKFIFSEMFQPGVNKMYKISAELCAENDLVIGHFIHHPLQAAAEKSGTPHITVALNHGALPTRYAPPVPLPDLGKTINSAIWKISLRILNKIILPFINSLRENEGLSPAKSYREVWESPLCNLIAVSPVLCEPKPDWGSNHHVCGFFKLKNDSLKWDWPEGLDSFLGHIMEPVYMTLGSMTGTANNSLLINETTRLLYDAAKIANVRAIIQSRWEHVTDIPEDKNIFRVNSSPYSRVFPKCAAIVHHGGAGTTQMALMSGKPSLIIGHIQDQFLFGAELVRLGVSPFVLNRNTVTPGKIGRGLREILLHPAMTQKAITAGKIMQEEDGTATAVRIINSLEISK